MNSTTSTPGKLWFILGGILSLLVALTSIALPQLATIKIAFFIGIFCIVSGVFLLLAGLFGNTKRHRILDIFSALLRIVLGVVLVSNLLAAIQALTLLIAVLFLAEGAFGILLAFQVKGKNPAWKWVLLNAVAALVLGVLLFAKFPSDSDWAIGLLFGINALFLGVSLITYGLALNRAQEA